MGAKYARQLESKVVREGHVCIRSVLMLESGKLGERYDGEFVVNSEGSYIYRCMCGSTSFGDLRDITLENPRISCLGCDISIPGLNLAGHGPRAYMIFGPGRTIPFDYASSHKEFWEGIGKEPTTIRKI